MTFLICSVCSTVAFLLGVKAGAYGRWRHDYNRLAKEGYDVDKILPK